MRLQNPRTRCDEREIPFTSDERTKRPGWRPKQPVANYRRLIASTPLRYRSPHIFESLVRRATRKRRVRKDSERQGGNDFLDTGSKTGEYVKWIWRMAGRHPVQTTDCWFSAVPNSALPSMKSRLPDTQTSFRYKERSRLVVSNNLALPISIQCLAAGHQ